MKGYYVRIIRDRDLKVLFESNRYTSLTRAEKCFESMKQTHLRNGETLVIERGKLEKGRHWYPLEMCAGKEKK